MNEAAFYMEVWCRLGSQRPDAKPWTNREGQRIVNAPTTHEEFLSYVETVSRFLSSEMLKLSTEVKKLDQIKLDAARSASSFESKTFHLKQQIEHSEALRKMVEVDLAESRGKVKALEQTVKKLEEKLGKKYVDDVANGVDYGSNEPTKRKIRL